VVSPPVVTDQSSSRGTGGLRIDTTTKTKERQKEETNKQGNEEKREKEKKTRIKRHHLNHSNISLPL
jgi:hypothetical protein